MLLIVGLIIGGIFGYKTFAGMMMKKYMMAGGMPVQTVSSVKATMQDWQPQLEAVGSVRAINGADLSSEVAGIVQSIAFTSGSDVEEGAPLLQLRADDDIAKLHALEATAKLADTTFQRDSKQLKAQAVSQAAVDSDAATLDSAKAQVVEQQAIIDKKTIKAPFSGHLGIRQVDVGQYLNPGAAIVSLQQLDPIYVDFMLPEQALSQLSTGQKVTVKVDAIAGTAFEGEILAINSRVDDATRNIQVRATFHNPDHKLLPGMFGNVAVNAGDAKSQLTLPQTAIVYNTYGNTVFLVHKGTGDDDKLTAQQSVVVTGETRGDQIAIISGVKEGDEVVSSGQIKLRNGAPIAINNDVQPTNDPDPKPHE
jgi:membrane fusion protein (multidrug efflux system)